ncbi:succinate dehydrogenase cytochrome b subunit [Halobacteriovorax sp. HLS]|uniref:succinate dehydrogenase cytochrome b subunit n=1 Tax=Halobacteriovorax sp. HLS TaxID=2234000 RepID=UPI000FDBCB28|nr:succinate dehydrogenase cytochrome b subunit [Halobacteriovorax sp. HLS]
MLFLRKNVMAFTGLFLCIFLVVHLAGNLILLLPAGLSKNLYNIYSHTLGENILIKVVSIILYLSIILHTVYAFLITMKNKNSLGEVDYFVNHKQDNSSWTSQNMGLLGMVILVFIVVHMVNFWMRVKLGFGEVIPLDQNGYKDVYLVVSELFRNPLYVIFYSVLMIPLGLHLKHGFSSAFKTLGVYKKSYIQRINIISLIFSIVTFIGFSVIPIVVYLRGLS